MKETDERAYQRYLDGDEDGLRVLLERHRERLTLFLSGYVHNMEDAEELTMDAFAAVAAGTSRFSGRSSFKTWLFAIGRNLALKHLRRNRHSVDARAELSNLDESAIPELLILQNEKNREIYRALESLPEDYRNVLYLQEFESMEIKEIARITGKTRKQIYNLSFRGRQAMREALTKTGFNDA